MIARPRAAPYPRRARTVLLAAATLLAIADGARAQFPAPLPTPNLELTTPAFNNDMVRLADGRIVVASRAQRINGQDRAWLARLLADGTLDSTWNPAPNSVVTATYVDPLGRLYVAGTFTQIAGQARVRFARFDAAGQLDPAFAPNVNANANAIVPGLANQVCIGGAFTQVNGVTRNRVACLSEIDGSLITTFNPGVNNTVNALHAAGDKLVIGGQFTQVGVATRNNLARVDLDDGSVDPWDPNVVGTVRELKPSGSTQLYVAGSIFSVGGVERRRAARISNATGAVDTGWNPGLPLPTETGSIYGMALDGSGGIVVGGDFLQMGGQPRRGIARLNGTNGNAVAAWNPGVDFGYVNGVLLEASGDVIIGGPFVSVGGGEHFGLARVFSGGGVDPQFNAVAEDFGSAFAIARVPGSGDLVIGGEFGRVNGQIRRNLVRISSAGVIDPNWTPGTDAQVRRLVVDALGRVYLGGFFDEVDGLPRGGLARLLNTADGSVDAGWNPTTFFGASDLLLRSEGLYVAAGIGSGLARLSTGAAATVDAGWTPTFTGNPPAYLAEALDGQLVISGGFTAVNGTLRSGLAKLATGASATLDSGWAPTVTTTTPGTIALAAYDNSIYLSGEFSAINGVTRNRLAKISAVGVGALDLGWAPSLTATEGYALRLATDSDHLYVAGNAGGGFFRPFFARYDHVVGWRDTTWRPAPDGALFDVLIEPDRVCTGGFTLRNLGGQPRRGFGCLPKLGVNAIFANGYED